MDNVQETPVTTNPVESKLSILDRKTPPQAHKIDPKFENSGSDFRPDRLKVPKAFKYPERYRSPTDLMVSPVTKGLLARSRNPGALLPPSMNQPKAVQDLMPVQDVVSFKIDI